MRVRRVPHASLLVAGLAAATGLLALARPSAADGHLSLSGDRVRIYNLVGKVEVVPGTGKSVGIDYVSGGKDKAELDVKTGSSNGASWLAIAVPGNRVIAPQLGKGSNCEIWVRSDGRFKGKSDIDGRKVRISGSGSGIEAWADLRIQVPRGQDITVYLGVGEASVTNVDGKLGIDCAAANVRASDTKGTLAIDTGSGEVSLEGVSGNIAVDTGSGDVVATRLTCEHLAIDTGSGSIHLTDASAASLALDTGSGDVDCDRITAPTLAIDTGSGSVGVDLTRDVESLAVDTGSGNVTILAPAGLGADIRLATGSGNITSDFPLRIMHKDDDTLRGTIGDGQGRIVVETGSGNVRLRKRAS